MERKPIDPVEIWFSIFLQSKWQILNGELNYSESEAAASSAALSREKFGFSEIISNFSSIVNVNSPFSSFSKSFTILEDFAVSFRTIFLLFDLVFLTISQFLPFMPLSKLSINCSVCPIKIGHFINPETNGSPSGIFLPQLLVRFLKAGLPGLNFKDSNSNLNWLVRFR